MKNKFIILGTLLVVAIIVISVSLNKEPAPAENNNQPAAQVDADIYVKTGKVKSVAATSFVVEIPLVQVNEAGAAEPFYQDRTVYYNDRTEIKSAATNSSGQQATARAADIRVGRDVTVYSNSNMETNFDVSALKIDIR